MGKSNVVFWESQGPEDIIYAYEHDDLRTLTSVTVPEHAVAIFARDGQLTGILEPGRHNITSNNIPWLTKLYQLALGYKETPFKVQIIFISQKIFNGRWGIRGMIKAAKGYEVPITLMANGDFQFRISDVPVFYTQVLGGLKSYTTGDVNNFMKAFINEQVTQQLSKQYYMEVLNNLEVASTSTKVLTEQYFTQRGIELLSLKIAEARLSRDTRSWTGWPMPSVTPRAVPPWVPGCSCSPRCTNSCNSSLSWAFRHSSSTSNSSPRCSAHTVATPTTIRTSSAGTAENRHLRCRHSRPPFSRRHHSPPPRHRLRPLP